MLLSDNLKFALISFILIISLVILKISAWDYQVQKDKSQKDKQEKEFFTDSNYFELDNTLIKGDQKLNKLYNHTTDKLDSNYRNKDKWKVSEKKICQDNCNILSNCIGYSVTKEPNKSGKLICLPFANQDFKCNTSLNSYNPVDFKEVHQYQTYLKTNGKNFVDTKCISNWHLGRNISIRSAPHPNLYWFQNHESGNIELIDREQVQRANNYPLSQFIIELDKNLLGKVMIRSGESYRPKYLTHNYPLDHYVTLESLKEISNNQSFIIIRGLGDPNLISFKLYNNSNLKGNYYLIAKGNYLEVSNIIDTPERRLEATFEIINSLSDQNIEKQPFIYPLLDSLGKRDDLKELDMVIGKPIPSPSEKISNLIAKNKLLIDSQNQEINKNNLILESSTRINQDRLDYVDRQIDSQMLGDNIINFYNLQKEISEIEKKLNLKK